MPRNLYLAFLKMDIGIGYLINISEGVYIQNYDLIIAHNFMHMPV